MYIVGLYIAIDPDSFELVVPEIRSMWHIELKSQDPVTGKLLVTVATDNEQEQKNTIERIKCLPFVMEAEIIYFYCYKDPDNAFDRTETTHSASQLYKSYNAIIHTQH